MINIFKKSLPTLKTLTQLLPYPKLHFSKKKQSINSNHPAHPDPLDLQKIQSIDFEPLHLQLDQEIQNFKEKIKDLKFGKLTSEIFKTIKISVKGEKLSIFDLGQLIPVNSIQMELYLYDKDTSK